MLMETRDVFMPLLRSQLMEFRVTGVPTYSSLSGMGSYKSPTAKLRKLPGTTMHASFYLTDWSQAQPNVMFTLSYIESTFYGGNLQTLSNLKPLFRSSCEVVRNIFSLALGTQGYVSRMHGGQ